MVKTLALVTKNARKAEEWRNFLRYYGLSCVQIDPAESTPQQLLELGHQVVCTEASRLVDPGTTTDAPLRHLQLVEHLSQIRCYRPGEVRDFSATRPGYIDLTAPVERGGWWDTQFRDAASGLSYAEQALQRGTKMSARDVALEQLIHYLSSTPRIAQHLTLDTEQDSVVQLDSLVSQTVLSHETFQCIAETPLEGLVHGALQQGLFFTLGRTRAQQVYFWPGLSGLPSVPRESQVDEAKFLFHDLVHFLIGRLVPNGPMTEHQRQVFLAWAMVEEAIALLLADGVFVDALKHAGIAYDFDQHKGYPFYCALGLAGQQLPLKRLQQVLWANVQFFVLGRSDAFACVGLDPADPRGHKYIEGFQRFAMGDWLWNERMSLHARADAAFYARWWQLAGPINAAWNLGLTTAAEVAGELQPAAPERLVQQVFEYIFERRIAPHWRPAPLCSLQDESTRAKRRWLLGQVGFFAAFDHVPAVARAGQLASQAACDAAMQVPHLAAFVQQAMQSALALGECSAAQVASWSEFFPLFPPYYIGYKARPGMTTATLAASILGSDGSRRELENELAGVAAVITDGERFLLSRRHAPHRLEDGKLSLLSATRWTDAEVSQVAWRRGVLRDFPQTAAVSGLADQAEMWRRFPVPDSRGGQFNLDVLLIRLSKEQFSALSTPLQGLIVARAELSGLLEHEAWLPGHDAVLSSYLADPAP